MIFSYVLLVLLSTSITSSNSYLFIFSFDTFESNQIDVCSRLIHSCISTTLTNNRFLFDVRVEHLQHLSNVNTLTRLMNNYIRIKDHLVTVDSIVFSLLVSSLRFQLIHAKKIDSLEASHGQTNQSGLKVSHDASMIYHQCADQT